MKRFFSWIAEHWTIVALALGAIGAFLLGRSGRGNQILDALKVEKKAQDAATATRKVAAEEGHEAAIAKIQAEHGETLAKLDLDQQVEAAKLADDPGALSSFLVKAAHK